MSDLKPGGFELQPAPTPTGMAAASALKGPGWLRILLRKGLGSVRISLCDAAEHPAGFAKKAEQKPSPE